MKFKAIFLIIFILPVFWGEVEGESGYRLWLRYEPVKNPVLLNQYRSLCRYISAEGVTQTIAVARMELETGLVGLLGKEDRSRETGTTAGSIILGTAASSLTVRSLHLGPRLRKLGKEGYLLVSTKIEGQPCTVIAGSTDQGVLYGVFAFLKYLQLNKDITRLSVGDAPRIRYRILDHWDNLDRTVERGYAGKSIWDWDALPGKTDRRYKDYARANASIGINGTVLNNVNADPAILKPEYLSKVQVLAATFRPYGIKVYLTAQFSAPVRIGGLKTADPLDPAVMTWWRKKAAEIYSLIPDFGGFCVKANSEGQPGPQDYGRTHADGANMLADVLAPFGGIVMWRAFVYSNLAPEDRTKQAYEEFKPLDGKFRKNVLLQVKNGPIDFQPREPFHPLFGAMPHTRLMPEFQITQEYLGFSTHLVYLGPLFQETLQSDTYAHGKGSTIARIIEATPNDRLSGIAGVSNIGSDSNWCGHPFAQANWYAYGRLAWDPGLSAETIAGEWLRLTFTEDENFVKPVKEMMLRSRETAVDYMTPLGLTMLMDQSHYRPAPWRRDKQPPVGTAESFHKADSMGLGFDRTSAGTNAVSQYFPTVRDRFENLLTCPEDLLLWFHHVPWNYRLTSGKTLWEELCFRYYNGAAAVLRMRKTWQGIRDLIDPERYEQVEKLLALQEMEAGIWRDASILYFQTFSKEPLPSGLEPPGKPLKYYKELK